MVREWQTVLYSWWKDTWQEISPGLRLCVPWGSGVFGIYPRGNQESENASCLVMSSSLWSHGLYSPWNSPGQNIGVGSLSLLQGIFPTQGLNGVSCTAGGFFTIWATREAPEPSWKRILFVCFGSAESSLLHVGFLYSRQAGATLDAVRGLLTGSGAQAQ